MKECRVTLMAGELDCSKIPDRNCILMANEGVRDGNVEQIYQTLKRYSTRLLQIYVQAHSPGGQWVDKCKKSPIIANVANSILSEREEQSHQAPLQAKGL